MKNRKLYLFVVPLMLVLTLCLCSVNTYAYDFTISNYDESTTIFNIISFIDNGSTFMGIEDDSGGSRQFYSLDGDGISQLVDDNDNVVSINSAHRVVSFIYRNYQTSFYYALLVHNPNNLRIYTLTPIYEINSISLNSEFESLRLININDDIVNINSIFYNQIELDFSQDDLVVNAINNKLINNINFLSSYYVDLGYTQGFDEATLNESVEQYNKGYDKGFDEGYEVGFDEGVISVELGSDIADFGSFGRIMLDTVDNFLSFEIVPNFSLMNILQLVMTICLVILFLKFFAGG